MGLKFRDNWEDQRCYKKIICGHEQDFLTPWMHKGKIFVNMESHEIFLPTVPMQGPQRG